MLVEVAGQRPAGEGRGTRGGHSADGRLQYQAGSKAVRREAAAVLAGVAGKSWRFVFLESP